MYLIGIKGNEVGNYYVDLMEIRLIRNCYLLITDQQYMSISNDLARLASWECLSSRDWVKDSIILKDCRHVNREVLCGSDCPSRVVGQP